MMQLSDHSRNRLLHTFSLWDVKHEYRGHVYGYLVQGWPPGSFYTAMFANDFAGAMAHSHPSNRVDELKNLSGWIQSHMPEQARGSYDAVEKWPGMSDDDRRTALERAELIYDTKTEVWLILKNEPTTYPRDRSCDPFDYTVI
jgi:hypothetical protein